PAVDGARITFDYNSIDFKTHPEKRIYRYKLQGYEDDWNPPTQATQIDNRDLAQAVGAGKFREDLYYRLNVFHIHIPTLRERAEDIPLLAEHCLQKACHQLGKAINGFALDGIEHLTNYPWPGNIREFENEIYRNHPE
ncbi:MAG: sigma 54-interacting transcriptional regulator, partial [Candidatus Poribacteria bacterium]|nr:sigma 54-interacting transcriptional regulator [Candidatus Poribacteria bacterium]